MDAIPAAKFEHPHDTLVSGGLRFLMGLIARVAVPWYAWEVSGPISGVPTPGRVRVAIEVALFAAAVAGAWLA